MPQVDRVHGLVGSLGVKAPVRVATTANITLYGTQTIDGVALAADDRVLVKNQTTGSENGIWVCKATTWERAADFDDARDVVSGTMVPVSAGTTYTGCVLRVSTTGAITIGTTSLTFAVVFTPADVASSAASAAAAAISASAADADAIAAAASASAADADAIAAAASASAADADATAAAASASTASGAAAAAAASYDSFDDRYLGSKAADPTLDNDGNALLTGALYWNSVSGEMRAYDGAAWVVTYTPSGATTAGDNTWTGVQTFRDNKFVITDDADTSKTVQLQVSGVSASTTRTLTIQDKNGTIACLDDTYGKEPIWIPADAWKPQVTNGPSRGSVELATNKQILSTLDFDSATAEYAQFSFRAPKAWNESTVTYQPLWSHPATTTNFGVAWQLEALCVSDGDANDAAWGTGIVVTDTGGTTSTNYAGAESSAVTAAGTPTEGDLVRLRISRQPANGSDTMAVDARLEGVMLWITTNAATDA